MNWTIGKASPAEIEKAEGEYNRYGRNIPDSQWGEEQEQEIGRLAENLRRLYKKHNIPANDQICL